MTDAVRCLVLTTINNITFARCFPPTYTAGDQLRQLYITRRRFTLDHTYASWEQVLSLSLRLNGYFPGGPGLDGTRMSPFCIQPRLIEVVVTTGAIRRAKLQSNCHHQQTITHLFTGRTPFPSPNQHCQSTEEKIWQVLMAIITPDVRFKVL